MMSDKSPNNVEEQFCQDDNVENIGDVRGLDGNVKHNMRDSNAELNLENILDFNLMKWSLDNLIITKKGEQGCSSVNWLKNELIDDDIKLNAVLIPKYKHRDFGRHDYLHNWDVATASLDPKMGVPSHFIGSHDETETENQTKHQFIQDMFVSKIVKLEQVTL